jgi:hypothetical protein
MLVVLISNFVVPTLYSAMEEWKLTLAELRRGSTDLVDTQAEPSTTTS